MNTKTITTLSQRWTGERGNPPPRPLQVYYQMANICDLPAVRELIVILLTWKFSAAVADNITILKIQELGMPKEHAATLTLLLTPVQIIVPMVSTAATST